MNTRTDLVTQRVGANNQLEATLDAFWPGAKAVFADVTSKIALAFLERYPTPTSAAALGEKRLGAFCAHHRSSRGQLPQPACPPASVLDGLQTLTRPRSHHRGRYPIRDVVADDAFVEHPGNAGRPRTIKPRPIASMHRPSGWSRSLVHHLRSELSARVSGSR
jgi:hypothetical protein